MVAIGCDRAGYVLKNTVLEFLKARGIEYQDFGVYDDQEVSDYPEMAALVAHKVASGEFEKGILLCGTGIGMSICANKVNGVRAAVCSDAYSCEYTRLHNDANILCLGGRVIDNQRCLELITLFFDTAFEGGRHARRVEMYTKIENGEI